MENRPLNSYQLLAVVHHLIEKLHAGLEFILYVAQQEEGLLDVQLTKSCQLPGHCFEAFQREICGKKSTHKQTKVTGFSSDICSWLVTVAKDARSMAANWDKMEVLVEQMTATHSATRAITNNNKNSECI